MAASQKPQPGTAISRVEPSGTPYALRSPVAQLLSKDSARAAIAPMLRPGESYERVMVEVYHAAAKNPAILDCTPQSIVSAVAQAVSTGLIIGDRVHLVPFGKKLEMVLDYKGAAELVLATGAVRYLDAQCVYAEEPFEYEQGSSPFIRHQPITDPKSRGALRGAYAVAKVTRDDVRILFMSIEEIDAIRTSKSKSWKQGALDAIPWYAKKTVIKQIVKLLPKTISLAKVATLFEREDALEEGEQGIGPGLAAENEIAAAVEEPSITEAEETAPIGEEEEDLPFSNTTSAREPMACEAYAIPAGLGPKSGTTLGTLSTPDLEQLYRWASKPNALKNYPDLAHNCSELLEARRLGDVAEPTQ
jgi:recombination protein RecT